MFVTAPRSQLEILKARYCGLLEAAPDAMVVVNQGGEIVLLNVQAEKQFGYSRDELVGQKVKNIIPEGFAERLVADGARSAADALAQQIGTGIELSGRRKDGSEFPIEIMLNPLESPVGILVTAAIRDISVLKDAEKHLAEMEVRRRIVEDALRESEERYRMLLDGVQDYAIFMMDPQGQIVSWNAGAERIKGYKADQIIGHNFSCFFPPADIKRGRPEEILRMTAKAGRQEEQGMRAERRFTVLSERHLHSVARPGRKSPTYLPRENPRAPGRPGVSRNPSPRDFVNSNLTGETRCARISDLASGIRWQSRVSHQVQDSYLSQCS
jgi:PAS domain S-box-containing protein